MSEYSKNIFSGKSRISNRSNFSSNHSNTGSEPKTLKTRIQSMRHFRNSSDTFLNINNQQNPYNIHNAINNVSQNSSVNYYLKTKLSNYRVQTGKLNNFLKMNAIK